MSVAENIAALNQAANDTEPVRAAIAQADDQLDATMAMVANALGSVPSLQEAHGVYQMAKGTLEKAQEAMAVYQAKLQEIAARLQASGS